MLASVLDDKEKIGDNLRIVRERRKLTQEQLAEKMDVNTQTVYRMEKGNYSMETFLAAMLILQADLQEIIPQRYTPKKEFKNQIDKLCDEIQLMPEQDQAFVVGAMKNAKEYIEYTRKNSTESLS